MGSRIALVLRCLAEFLQSSRRQAAIDRQLSGLNDHLLRDLGVDVAGLRDRVRIAELGSPSRQMTATEIVQGVPAEDLFLSVNSWARTEVTLERSKPAATNCEAVASPITACDPPSQPEAGFVSIRIVPPRGFKA